MRQSLIIAPLLMLAAQAMATGPSGYSGLPESAYQPLDLPALKRAPLTPGSTLTLPGLTGVPKRNPAGYTIVQRHQHPNGDVFVLARQAGGGQITATIGSSGLFGSVHGPEGHRVLTTEASGAWAVSLPQSGLVFNTCDTPEPTSIGRAPASAKVLTDVIDVLVVYNPAFADRYPGDLAQTRVNYFMDIANVTLANSVSSLALRLVGTELITYTNGNSNFQARNDMASALASPSTAAPGMESLQALRNQSGADLVIYIQPHDIQVRGSCGIAFFPDNDPTLGVNVVSDGLSSWSVCSDDVLIHEVGHNLGAGHQAGFGGGAFDPRGSALTNPGQYSTTMGSFGTGRPDRFRGLFMFSNPLANCGGQPCGVAGVIDNTAVMQELAPVVAAYQPAVSGVPMPAELDRADSDMDGDGVVDWEDHFPFDASEQADADLDGVGDIADAFPNNAAESADTDGDGQGDNADPDADNDGVGDGADAFPLDASETTDTDLDGVGDQADAFITNVTEYRDTDGDRQGNNSDPDDDGDGVNELSDQAQDLLVISTGNSRILRFDAQTGQARGIEVLPEDGLLTFQSDLVYRDGDHTLLYLSDSAVKRIDLLDRRPLGTYVAAYDDSGQTSALGTGFPTGLAARPRTFSPISTSEFYVSTNTSPLILAGSGGERATFVAPRWNGVDGEVFVDVISDGADVLALGRNTLQVYRGPRSQPMIVLGGPGNLQAPQRMALTADRRLLITDAGRNAVVAVDADSGVFQGDLAHVGLAGYSSPSGIAVTDTGEVLVAVSDQDAVLRFDGASGQFLGELVSPGQGGLDQPRAMALVPQLIDRYPADPDRVIRPNPGLWFSPATSGRGFDIEVFGSALTAIWYAYDEDGNPLWYYSAGTLDGFEYSGTLFVTELSESGVMFNEVGSLALSFASERQAEMTWQIGEASGSEDLQWLEFSVEPAAIDHTGLWGRPDGPGWGITLATQGSVTVALAFIYDDQGAPRWVISDAVTGEPPFEFSMVAFFSDTLCPTCSGSPASQQFPAGTMTITVPEVGRWSSEVSYPSPLTGDWLLDNTELIRFSEAPERPR